MSDRGLDLWRIGPIGDADEELWELPVVWKGVGRAALPQVEIEVEAAGQRRRHTIRVPRPPMVGAAEISGSDERDGATETAAEDDVPGHVDRLWQHHAEIVRAWCDGDLTGDRAKSVVRRAASISIAPLADFCSDYWRDDRRADALHALIVDIAHKCRDLIERLSRSPRRVLRRERTQVPIAQAQQVDAACLRWLVRQPGRGIEEKAGPRQRVMAVVREPSIDTPENRVLRRFLDLCAREARLYVRDYREFATSPKVIEVRRFGWLARRLLTGSELRSIPPMVGVPEPNYVLQFDPDYSQVWYWYLRLIRKERERENLRAWHHRTWAERCRTAVLAFLEKDCLVASSFRGWAHLRREPFSGSYIAASTSAGPWAYPRTAAGSLVRFVERLHLGTNTGLECLAKTACDWALVLQDAFDTRRVHAALGVYSMHVSEESDSELVARLAGLEALIRPKNEDDATPVAGLVLVPSVPGRAPYLQSPERHVTACRIPGPDEGNRSHGWTALGKCLEAFAAWRRR